MEGHEMVRQVVRRDARTHVLDREAAKLSPPGPCPQ